ncbi:MAG TPA: response regulator [Planctomycetota bacterium]|jgi:DNA-binding response OmpR family regulator|nr:response regulator [Planctomycetota bacterium]
MHRIFLVHDQQESPNQRREALAKAGYEVSLFTSETDVIAQLHKELPALILVDILLEGPNGFEVCKRIRTLLDAAQMPVILGSHIYRSRIYRDEAQAAGAQRYLRYPVEMEELVETVGEVIAEAAAANRAA